MATKKTPSKREQELQRQIDELQARLTEADETLRAIREGEVDAVVVSGAKGDQIFSLVGADSIYRLIVETMTEAAFTVTFDGTILFCNAQFGQLVQYPLEMIVGHSLREFIMESEQPAAASLLADARLHPVKQRLVFQSLSCNRVPAHVSASVISLPDALSICVVATDLTELENSTELIQQLRRQQEILQQTNEELATTEAELRNQNEELAASRAELYRARERYQDLFESAPDGYVVTDSNGTIREVNQTAVGLLGMPAAQLKGTSLPALVPASGKAGFLQTISALRTGTNTVPGWEVEFPRPQSPPFWAAITAAASRDERGRIVSLRWLIRDVTPNKRAEQALRDSERLYRAIGESIDYGIWICDPQGRNTYASESFLKLVGITQEQCSGLGWGDVLHPDDVKATIAAWNECVRGGGPWYREHRYRGADGQWHPILACGVAVRNERGEVTSWAGINLDISRLKEAQEDLRRSMAELKRSNDDLEQFAYVASHDLQEPLRMVSGFLDLLAGRYGPQLDEKAREYIGFSVDAAQRMQRLIKDVLEYSRVGRKNMELRTVEVRAIVAGTVAILGPVIQEAGAAVTYDELPTIHANPVELSQIFQNLIGNALKFRSPERACVVHVSARQEGDQWIFAVADNGIGIPEASRDRIFKIFERLHARDKYAGTGIGLAICKKIVERHGGRIWVDSQPGQGSTFCLALPIE